MVSPSNHHAAPSFDELRMTPIHFLTSVSSASIPSSTSSHDRSTVSASEKFSSGSQQKPASSSPLSQRRKRRDKWTQHSMPFPTPALPSLSHNSASSSRSMTIDACSRNFTCKHVKIENGGCSTASPKISPSRSFRCFPLPQNPLPPRERVRVRG